MNVCHYSLHRSSGRRQVSFQTRVSWGKGKYIKQNHSIRITKVTHFGPQVVESQDGVSRLQALNGELQNRLLLLERSDHDPSHRDDPGLATTSPWKQVRSCKRPLNEVILVHSE